MSPLRWQPPHQALISISLTHPSNRIVQEKNVFFCQTKLFCEYQSLWEASDYINFLNARLKISGLRQLSHLFVLQQPRAVSTSQFYWHRSEAFIHACNVFWANPLSIPFFPLLLFPPSFVSSFFKIHRVLLVLPVRTWMWGVHRSTDGLSEAACLKKTGSLPWPTAAILANGCQSPGD